MNKIKTATHTESEERVVRLPFKYHVEEFEPLMRTCKSGEYLLSAGVSSKLAPSAVWKLRIYPNGRREKDKGNISVYLCLTGSVVQADNEETLDTTLHIYLVDSSGSKIDVARRWAENFGEEERYKCGWNVDHERVKKALRADGSLLVAADLLVPYDDGVGVACEGCALRDKTRKQCDAVKALLESALKEIQKLSKANKRLEAQLYGMPKEKLKDQLHALLEQLDGPPKESALRSDETSRRSSVNSSASRSDKPSSGHSSVNSSGSRSDKPSSDQSSVKIDNRPIENLLNARNVDAMAKQPEHSHSLETLKEHRRTGFSPTPHTPSDCPREEREAEEMAEIRAVTDTVKKRRIRLTFEYHVKEFGPLRESCEPGECLLSGGVSSELAPSAVWKLLIYPNGYNEDYKGKITVYLCLTGPMADNEETLDATLRIYLVDASGSKIDVTRRCTENFGEERYKCGWNVDHDQVKKALRANGSLLVACEVEFVLPGKPSSDDGDTEDNSSVSRSDKSSSEHSSVEVGRRRSRHGSVRRRARQGEAVMETR